MPWLRRRASFSTSFWTVSASCGADMLRSFAIAAGICCSILFVVIGLRYQLQLYGDGAIFSYAAAVQDAWAFHWHNISGRLVAYFFCLAPAEFFVGLTGSPS